MDDPGAIETVQDESKDSKRGRSKRRQKGKKRSKKKEPFSHIASGIIPFAALASASPNAAKYIGKSRSPSPIARAIAFAGRIGHVIAAGDKLERSLSERDIYRRSGSAIDLSQMKQISKSHPGPSGFEEPVADLEVEEGYESVKEIRSKLFARLEEDGRKMDERPVMPLPDEEDGVEHNSQEMEDLYSKVVKHGVVNSRIEKLQAGKEVTDESDDLTTVSEEDEEVSSKLFVVRTKSKIQNLQLEDTSDGPSDGEVFRIPSDVVKNEDLLKKQFETIEELENEDLSPQTKHGLVSPSSTRSKGSSRDSVGHQPVNSARSTHSKGSEQGRRFSRPQTPQEASSRPQTPREMGREAALRRLEELGLDGINKEFGLVIDAEEEQGEWYSRDGNNKRQIYEDDVIAVPSGANFDESTPSFEDEFEVQDQRVSNFRDAFGPKQSRPSGGIVVEEALVQSAEMAQHHSSHEMRLDELVDESQNGAWLADGEHRTKDGTGSGQSASFSPPELKSPGHLSSPADRLNKKQDNPQESRKSQKVSQNLRPILLQNESNAIFETVESARSASLSPTGLRTPSQSLKSPISQNSQEFSQNSQRMLTESGPSAYYEVEGTKSRPATMSPREKQKTTDDSGGKNRSNVSLDSQRQAQEEIKQKQDSIINTITALQKQFEIVAKEVTSGKKETNDHEEKLFLLRKLIKEEQEKYYEQQKILEEQQEKIIKARQSPRSRPNFRFSSAPASNRQQSEKHRPKSAYLDEKADQFRILENRLKSVEAERLALLDLNSSLQDENNTLKKLAFNQENGDPSGIVFKKQNAELIDSNKNLKSLVHRLNIELSRYQAKYRPPRKEEIEGLTLPEEGPVPEWLVNMKYLSPLVMAYDDRLRDKNEVIDAYETNLASIKSRMLEIVRENQKLHMINSERSDNHDVDFHEWNLLQEHAKLVVEENTILMQEIDLKDRRIDEMQEEFEVEIEKLTKKLRLVENERRNSQMNVSSLQIDHEVLKKRCKEVEIESSMKIKEEDVRRRIEEIRRPLTEKIESFEKDKDHFDTRFQAVLKEKQELAVKFTDANAILSQLKLELEFVRKSLRKLEKKYLVLQNQCEAAKEKEFVATETLAQVLSVAEKNSNERDEFARMVENHNNETIMSYRQIIEEEKKTEMLRKEREKYKKLAKKNAAEVLKRVNEKDEEIANIKNQFNEEISNLKETIRDRQMMVDLFQTDKKQFENEIDVLWQSVTEENEEFRKSSNK